MKKLSIIMVVAMLLTTFAAMFVTPAAAADDVTLPDSVTDITAGGTKNAGYELYQYDSDAAAVADGAIGRFTVEGGNGYAKSWTAVGGNSHDCGSSYFVMINDTTGRASIDVGGRPLTIDGSGAVGLKTGTAPATNHTITSDERVLHLAQKNTAGKVTLKNVTVTSTGGETGNGNRGVQINGGTLVIGEGTVLNLNCTDYGFVMGHSAAANVIVEEGATINSSTTKGCNAAALAGLFGFWSASPCTLTINGGTINTTNQKVVDTAATSGTDKIMGTVTVNGGTVTTTGNVEGAFFNVQNININGGTIEGYRPVQIAANGGCTLNMTGGTVISTQNYAFDFKGNNNTITITGGEVKAESASGLGLIMLEGSAGTDVLNIGGTAVISSNKEAIRAHNQMTLELNISGGIITSASNTIVINNASSELKLNVTGGTLTSTASVVLALAAKGTVEIYGGTFNAGPGKRVMQFTSGTNAKTVDIYGGTFNHTFATNSISGTTVNLGAIFASGATVNVCGGNFVTSETAGAHLCSFSGGAIRVYGGNFTGAQYASARVNYDGSAGVLDIDGTADVLNGSTSHPTVVMTGESLILNPETVNGASIRTALGSMGIRFQSTVGADAIAYATKLAGGDANKVIYGTLIIPADYLEKTNGAFTVEALEAAGCNYAAVTASQGITNNADGSVTFRAALVNIQAANQTRDFVARAYICVDGVYVYATDASAERSIDYVAKAALADVKTTATGDYQTAVTSYYVSNGDGTFTLTTGTAYSKYSVPALTAIKNCIAD